MANITTPHDKFFRGNMHNIEIARGFLNRYMSEQDKAPLDLSTIQLRKTSQIDKHLTESISDLVYSCKYKDRSLGESRVIVLVEHQSTPHKLMPFRVYHYLFNLLADELSDYPKKDKLPAACALVFYHGEQTPYPYSLNLQDSFDDPARIMANFWKKPIHLIDINQYEDDDLIEQHVEGLMAIALKHGRDKEVSEILLRIVHTLLTIDFNDDFRLQFSERTASYLLAQGEIRDKQKFKTQVAKLPNSVRGTIMTFAEEMKHEGRIEGIVERSEEVAINGLKEGLTLQLISRLAGVSVERIIQIKQEHNL